MSGKESPMRKAIVRALRPLDAVSVENPAHPGTPDVNHMYGWIELKQLQAWPVREETIVRIPHFTQQQRVWLIRRVRRGGMAQVLLKVGEKEWFLFCGDDAGIYLGETWTQRDIRLRAVMSWTRFPGKSLLNYLVKKGKDVCPTKLP